MSSIPPVDVLVAGGGNAAMCAALAAREAGASVLVVESAPIEFRAGNSRHARNFRCMHDAPLGPLEGRYDEAEYYDDLLRVTGGKTDEDLARFAIRSSPETFRWLTERGVRFQPSLAGTLHLGRTNAFFLGGGKALVNTYYALAERLGIGVRYDTEVVGLNLAGGEFKSAIVQRNGDQNEVPAKAFVAASGGFEANIEWLKESWGQAAGNFIIRGTPHNKGRVLRLLLNQGAAAVGDASQCHAIAVDARGPKFDGGIVTRLDTVPVGIVVNKHGQRFYDDGGDLWPKRYAIWGRLIAQQPDQIAYSILDAKMLGDVMPSAFPAVRADSLPSLAVELGLEAAALERSVAQFNAAVVAGRFDLSKLDDCCTRGLVPEKTHWARRIDTPPFWGYPLRPGITFTYLGVKVDGHAAVVDEQAKAFGNVFAAGEMMAGNVLGQGYLAGFGMTIGATFGRLAGEEAARVAK